MKYDVASDDCATEFSVRRAREVVDDLFAPRPEIYWCDLLITVSIAYTAAWTFLNAPAFSVSHLLSYAVAGVALYRASTFIHEIVHLHDGEMNGFKVCWNLLAGVPMLMPSFLYESHIAHHNAAHYGTARDGEYLPLARSGLPGILMFFAQVPLLPVLVFTRFAVLTPVSLLVPSFRSWVLERASSLVINFQYRRKPQSVAHSRWWLLLECLCCLRAWAIVLVVVLGGAHWSRIPGIYALAVLSLGLNHARTFVAHRYAGNGDPMDYLEQLGDSFNIVGNTFIGGLLSEPLFPVGTRYHALHHLFPRIPYHNLGKAHQRLTRAFRPDSPYHAATVPGVWQALRAVSRAA